MEIAWADPEWDLRGLQRSLPYGTGLVSVTTTRKQCHARAEQITGGGLGLRDL